METREAEGRATDREAALEWARGIWGPRSYAFDKGGLMGCGIGYRRKSSGRRPGGYSERGAGHSWGDAIADAEAHLTARETMRLRRREWLNHARACALECRPSGYDSRCVEGAAIYRRHLDSLKTAAK